MTLSQQSAAPSAADLLEHARDLGYLVISLPGVGTYALAPDGRGDDELCAELVRRSDELEVVAARAMTTDEEAQAWARAKRLRRACLEG